MTKSFKAVQYKPDMTIKDILTKPGDTVNVFVPADFFQVDLDSISQRIVFGSRPYGILSDILGIIAHMGILFPHEKQRKNAPIKLSTSPSAPIFGKQDVSLDDFHTVEDDFRFFGVIISLTAVPPLGVYPSVQGFALRSQYLTDYNNVALDILDYSFISEFEPRPEIVADPLSIVHQSKISEYELITENSDLISFEYSPELFSEDKDGYLFKDFQIIFEFQEYGITFKQTRNNFVVLKVTEEKDEPIDKAVPLSEIKFLENGIQIRNEIYSGIKKVTVEPIYDSIL